MSLNGHYEPSAPGARTISEARPLWLDGRHVTAEVHDGTVTVFVGLEIAYEGALPEFITSGSLVNAFAAEMAYAWAYPSDDDHAADVAATDALIAQGAEIDAMAEAYGTANPVTVEPREVSAGWDGASRPVVRSVDACGCRWTRDRKYRLSTCTACLSGAVRRNV